MKRDSFSPVAARYLAAAVCLLALLLCGCGTEAEETAASTTAATAPPSGLYDPNSTIEETTQGAVRAFQLAGHNVTGFRFMGSRLLLFAMDTHAELTSILALEGENLALTGITTLDCGVYAGETTLSPDGQTLAYYNAQENSVVVLSDALEQIRRIQLPDQVTQRPVLASDLSLLYYCQGSQIYALDLNTGISRLLKQHSCASQTPTALHFGGSVLEVFVTQDDGSSAAVFVSTENGETLGMDSALLTVTSEADRYLLQRRDGTVTETLVGHLDSEPEVLEAGVSEALYPAFSLNAAVGVTGSVLRLYDLGSGELTSSVELGPEVLVREVCADPGGRYVWLRATDLQSSQELLLRWDTKATEVTGSDLYLHRRYTAQDPDTEGIARCQQTADELGALYQLRIHVTGGDAPEGYSFTAEHQVRALEEALSRLDEALAQYPPEFFRGLGSDTQSGAVRILLVRDIQDIAGKSVSDQGGLHYVLSGDHFLCLTVGSDLEAALAHQLCHVLDSYVFAQTAAFDRWDSLNPAGFAYYGSYDYEESAQDDPNLCGQTQAFVSSYSMTYAREDRATLFAAAMTPGNDALFAAPSLQAKLRQLCTAIRQAYGWEETDTPLPWERYLKSEE